MSTLFRREGGNDISSREGTVPVVRVAEKHLEGSDWAAKGVKSDSPAHCCCGRPWQPTADASHEVHHLVSAASLLGGTHGVHTSDEAVRSSDLLSFQGGAGETLPIAQILITAH